MRRFKAKRDVPKQGSHPTKIYKIKFRIRMRGWKKID